MNKLDKAILGLECCLNGITWCENDCPYYPKPCGRLYGANPPVMRDALDILYALKKNLDKKKEVKRRCTGSGSTANR